MSFIWPQEPSTGASSEDLADYAELICLRDGLCSITKLSRDLGRLEDNHYESGVPEYSELDEHIELAFKEIERRQSACGNYRYPFTVGDTGKLISLPEEFTTTNQLYYFLLLATRLNMKSNRKHSEIDGTLLFEHVSAAIVRSFWGDRSETMVFGTGANEGGFETKVNELCRRLNEGGCFENRNRGRPTQNDGRLDVIVWKGFSDKRLGRLIGFGQCKTGRNWRDSLAQLQCSSFIKSWLHDPLPVDPVRLFFVTEVVGEEQWYSQVSQAGLLFDRCRLMDYYLNNIPTDIMGKVYKWVSSVVAEEKFYKITSNLNRIQPYLDISQ